MEQLDSVEEQEYFKQMCQKGQEVTKALVEEYGSAESAWNHLQEKLGHEVWKLQKKGILDTTTQMLGSNATVAAFHNIMTINGIEDMNFDHSWNMIGYIKNNRNPFRGNVLDAIKALKQKVEAARKAAQEAEQELYKAIEKEKNKKTAKYKVGDKVLVEATVSGITVGNEEPEYTVIINAAFEYGAGTQRVIRVEERKVSKNHVAYSDIRAQEGYAEKYFGKKDEKISEGYFLVITPKDYAKLTPYRYTRTETEQIVAKLLTRLKEEK